MKHFIRIVFFILAYSYFGAFGQESDSDSLQIVYDSPRYSTLSDSLRADICRRLSIDNVRKSTQTAFRFADEFYNIAKTRGDETGEAIALNLMGVCLVSEGNLEKGLEYYLQSLALRRKIGDEKMISNTLNNIGTVYVRLDDFEKGIDYYNEALSLRIKTNDLGGMAQTLNNMGVTQKMMGNYDSAIVFLEKSLTIKRKLNDKELIASSLNNLGEIAALNGNEEKAMAYFNESLACRQMINDVYGMSKTLVSMSNFLSGKGAHHKALHQLQKALNTLVPGFSDTGIYSNPQPGIHEVDYNTIIILKNKAEIFRDIYNKNTDEISNLKSSFDLQLLIIEFMDQVRQGLGDEKSKLYLMDNNRDLYSDAVTKAIEMLYATKDSTFKAHAFEIAERGKARTLLDLITENEARLNLRIPNSLFSYEDSLKREIAMLQKADYDNAGKHTVKNDSLKQLIFESKRKLEAFNEMLEMNYPEYNALKYGNSRFSFVDLQQKLKEDELFLQYHITDSILYIFIITQTENSILQVALQPDFSKNLGVLQSFLTSGKGIDFSANREEFILASRRLYEYLVYPVEQYVKKQKYIIVPDGPLFYIPFEILIADVSQVPSAGYASLPYLIKSHPISYNYSASMFINAMNTTADQHKSDLAAFALSFKKEKYTYSAANVNQPATRGEDLAELPGVRAEVNNILEIMHGQAYFDSLATELKFKNTGGNPQVLHIATHGIIDNNRPMFSRLVFAPDAGNVEDGNLYTWELFNMDIGADMAVLSACNTGYGKLQQGEGMMTLARGFMYAGVPSLVISLWNVNDEATVKIMTGFYRYLAEGEQKEVALQKSKLDYLAASDDMMANPCFWGGFIHLGNTTALELNKQRGSRNIIFFGGAAMLLFLGIIVFKRRRWKR